MNKLTEQDKTETGNAGARPVEQCVIRWQPIETAPKNRIPILLYLPGTDTKIYSGYFDDHPKCKCWIAGGYMRINNKPTHWAHLPKPPYSAPHNPAEPHRGECRR